MPSQGCASGTEQQVLTSIVVRAALELQPEIPEGIKFPDD